MVTLLICGAVFVGVAALVAGTAMMFRGETSTNAEMRLEHFAAAKPGEAKKKDEGLLLQPLDSAPQAIEQFVARFLDLRVWIEQAGLAFTPAKFLAVCGGLAGLGFVIGLVAPIHKGFAPGIAVTLGVLPFAWLYLKRSFRLGKFAKQLPDALELIGRALRAGHSLGAGMRLAAEEMADPIGKEFSRAYEEQNFGVPLEQALEGMTERVPNLDLRFFVTAVLLQRQTGGDLAEILDKIGHLIRERFRIYGQVQALTGEGRLSGIVLLALPPALFGVMWYLNPGYIMKLFEDPLGHKMLAVAAVMQIFGAIVIQKIITIKV